MPLYKVKLRTKIIDINGICPINGQVVEYIICAKSKKKVIKIINDYYEDNNIDENIKILNIENLKMNKERVLIKKWLNNY